MKQFHIPRLGDIVTLASDWTFAVINDPRNHMVLQWSGHPEYSAQSYYPLGVTSTSYYGPRLNKTVQLTIPKGTRLKIDRIYIRKGQRDFDSVTFIAPDLKALQNCSKKSVRFFAKLDDVNTMVVE